ncbi:PILS2 [Symbiodinium pilosum]|uniref:PILS2 protein n=1 Tax=Symbiodinium pilosum TaxID=2952 RepID=A0A812W8L9_SYMPI|nr:PILS2 [Symbiodinium pilosum]
MLATALVVSLKAVSKIVIICAGGAYLEKAGVLHKEMRKGVSEAFVKLLLPCLLFTRIIPTMSLETLPKLGWLAMANLLYVSLGLCIGYLAVLLTNPPRSMRRILMATPAIGHANSIPFMLVSLVMTEDPAFQPGDSTTAQGYVGLYLVMHSITLWGVGMNVIKKEKEDEPALTAHGTPNSQAEDSQRPQTLGRAAGLGLGSGHSGGAMSVSEAREEQWSHSISGLELGSPVTSSGPNTKGQQAICDPKSLRRFVPKWVNRPMATAILSALLGLIPGLHGVLVPDSGPLNFLFGAMSSLGSAGPAISLLAVGANFVADGFPRPSLIGYVPLVALIVGRLLILPACCIALWVTLRHYTTFFPADPALMLVMCIECCTPTAYNLVTVCILNGVGAKELTAGLFYQNLVAIFALTAWTTVIMSFVI